MLMVCGLSNVWATVETYEEGGIEYEYDTETLEATLVYGSDCEGELVINATVGHGFLRNPLTVVGIAEGAFEYSVLTKVSIPSTVKTIGQGAFKDCDDLTEITIDENSPYLSFQGGVLFNKGKTVLYHALLPVVGEYEIPEGVMSVGDNAFRGCTGLTGVAISSTVAQIGDHAFYDCTSLNSIVVATGNSYFAVQDGILFNHTKKKMLRVLPSAIDGAYTIPSYVNEIGRYAFEMCSGLTSLTIPCGVTTVGNGAFDSCSSLEELTVDFNYDLTLANIENHFSGCNLRIINVRTESDYKSAQIKKIKNEGIAIVELAIKAITLNKDGYATVYSPYPFVVADDCEAAAIIVGTSEDDVSVKYFYESGDVVPDAMPVLIKGATPNAVITMVYPKSYEGMRYPKENLLRGVYEETTLQGDVAYYVLGYDSNGENVGFYKQESPTVSANQCYMELPYVEGMRTYFLLTTPSAPTVGYFVLSAEFGGFGTYNVDHNYVMPEGVQGGVVTGVDEAKMELVVDYCYNGGDIVPANTALLLKGPVGDYVCDFADNETPTLVPEVNLLCGTLTETSVTGQQPYAYMVLRNDSRGLGYYFDLPDGFGISEILPHSSYLRLPYKAGMSDHYLIHVSKDGTEGSFKIVAQEGYATYYTDHAFVMPEYVQGAVVRGVKTNNRLDIDYCYDGGDIVPARTALLLRGASGEYTYTYVDSDLDAPSDNMLHGLLEGEQMVAENDTYTYYILSRSKAGTDIGFYWGTEDGTAPVTLNLTNKAYLKVPKAQSNARLFVFDMDTTTGVEDVSRVTIDSDATVFDLSGRKVTTLVKGSLYIVNGNKYISK